MKGIIEHFDNSKTGKNNFGEWRLTKIKVAGNDYTTFEDVDCKYGDLVEFTYAEKEDGKRNIVKGTLKVLEKGIGEPP